MCRRHTCAENIQPCRMRSERISTVPLAFRITNAAATVTIGSCALRSAPAAIHRIDEGDRPLPDNGTPRLPVVAVLDRLRSAYNVGNIFRLAEALRLERIVTTGYTASPPHPKLVKTARGCDLLVPFTHTATAAAVLTELQDQSYTLYAVETVSGARPPWEIQFQFPAAFVFGNEALGISPEALQLCREAVRLPCAGMKNSINVANCAAVILYEAQRQWHEQQRRS